jgi:hypothetical protein
LENADPAQDRHPWVVAGACLRCCA